MPSLPLPYVVKAPRQGSTVGVYIVKEESESRPGDRGGGEIRQPAADRGIHRGGGIDGGDRGAAGAADHHDQAEGWDFTISRTSTRSSIRRRGAGAEHYCPAPLPEKVARLIREIALAAHGSLGLEVYSRVDFILSRDGEPYVLEINTIPGMTEASLLPEAAGVAGIGYGELCERIIELSLARIQKEETPRRMKAKAKAGAGAQSTGLIAQAAQAAAPAGCEGALARGEPATEPAGAGVAERAVSVLRGGWGNRLWRAGGAAAVFLAEPGLQPGGGGHPYGWVADAGPDHRGDGHSRGEEYFRDQPLGGAEGTDGAAAGGAGGDRAHPAEQAVDRYRGAETGGVGDGEGR